MYEFDRNTNVDQVATLMRALVLSDDHIDAILFNGVKIDFTAIQIQNDDFQGWLIETEFSTTQKATILEKGNMLEFIVHNNNSGSNFA